MSNEVKRLQSEIFKNTYDCIEGYYDNVKPFRLVLYTGRSINISFY